MLNLLRLCTVQILNLQNRNFSNCKQRKRKDTRLPGVLKSENMEINIIMQAMRAIITPKAIRISVETIYLLQATLRLIFRSKFMPNKFSRLLHKRAIFVQIPISRKSKSLREQALQKLSRIGTLL